MSCRDINFNAGFNGCNDKVAVLRNEVVFKDLDHNYEPVDEEDLRDSYVYVDQAGKPKKMALATVMSDIPVDEVQSDWDEEDDTKYNFIRNKPEIYINEDLVSLYNIGGIQAGQIFEKGTSVTDIMKELLSVTHPVVFRFGVISPDDEGKFPGDVDIYSLEEIEISTAELLTEGFTRTLTLKNQFFAIAIPNSSIIEIKKCYQGGYAIQLAPYVLDEEWTLFLNADDDVKGDTYIAPSTGTYTFDYRFKLK